MSSAEYRPFRDDDSAHDAAGDYDRDDQELDPAYTEPAQLKLFKGLPHEQCLHRTYEQLVEQRYDRIRANNPGTHTVTEQDMREAAEAADQSMVDVSRGYMEQLFVQEEDGDDRYSLVKELPFYHFADYPDTADPRPVQRYLHDQFGGDGAGNSEKYERQELGDIDIGVFDRETETVHVVEVKGNNAPEDRRRAERDLDCFAAYADAFDWDVESEIVMFDEAERKGRHVIAGSIERHRYTPDSGYNQESQLSPEEQFIQSWKEVAAD